MTANITKQVENICKFVLITFSTHLFYIFYKVVEKSFHLSLCVLWRQNIAAHEKAY